MTNDIGTKLTIDGCTKWPELPSRTLARKLFNENKGVWASIEICRSAIRYRRGRSKARDKAGGKTRSCAHVIRSTAPTRQHDPQAYIPESDERAFLPFVVEVDKDTRALVLGDIHMPYHRVDAVRAAVEKGKKEECEIIILNGDTLDFHRLSRFQKDPRARTAAGEIVKCNELLDSLDDIFPKARKIWKDGNHDERYDSYITANAEEVWSLIKAHASLPKLLELEDRGWEYVSEKRPIYLGKLTVLHGHELPTPVIGPVNAARGLFLRTKASAMVNHHHQTSEHSEPDIRGKLITTWSLGCLCELSPYYSRFNRWNHGAATVDIAKDGDFRVHNFRISSGKLLN